jgi:hypothetical protein
MSTVQTENRAGEAGNRPIKISTKRARGGFLGLPVLYVLVAGTFLAIFALAVIFSVFHHVAA